MQVDIVLSSCSVLFFVSFFLCHVILLSLWLVRLSMVRAGRGGRW